MVRRSFIADLRRRFAALLRAINEFLITQDSLGLKPVVQQTPRSVFNAREFAFVTDPGKLKAFNRWLAGQVSKGILSVPEGQDPSKPWLSKYIESAYRKGKTKAFIASKKKELIKEGDAVGARTTERILQSSFTRPEATAKVELLATRSFEQLKGVTASMGGKMNRIMAQGIADGRGPKEIAKELADEVNISQRRAETIARSEVINAHADGTLDQFEELGVQDVTVEAEWSTAGDDRVCPECAALEGKIFSIDEARGMIPRHPNCRCVWLAA